jgi:uncharacterized membrane protein SpoIIM required for sporulation
LKGVLGSSRRGEKVVAGGMRLAVELKNCGRGRRHYDLFFSPNFAVVTAIEMIASLFNAC